MDNLSNVLGLKGNNLFPSKKHFSCGECAAKSILKMYGKDTKISISDKEGTSPKMITETLNDSGIDTEIKDSITIDDLKPRSILYYPEKDHYVSFERISKNRVLSSTRYLINDSDFDKPQLLSKKELEKLWLKDGAGWVIETS